MWSSGGFGSNSWTCHPPTYTPPPPQLITPPPLTNWLTDQTSSEKTGRLTRGGGELKVVASPPHGLGRSRSCSSLRSPVKQARGHPPSPTNLKARPKRLGSCWGFTGRNLAPKTTQKSLGAFLAAAQERVCTLNPDGPHPPREDQ